MSSRCAAWQIAASLFVLFWGYAKLDGCWLYLIVSLLATKVSKFGGGEIKGIGFYFNKLKVNNQSQNRILSTSILIQIFFSVLFIFLCGYQSISTFSFRRFLLIHFHHVRLFFVPDERPPWHRTRTGLRTVDTLSVSCLWMCNRDRLFALPFVQNWMTSKKKPIKREWWQQECRTESTLLTAAAMTILTGRTRLLFYPEISSSCRRSSSFCCPRSATLHFLVKKSTTMVPRPKEWHKKALLVASVRLVQFQGARERDLP